MSEYREKETTDLWEDWRKCQAYQSTLGLSEGIPKYVRFYEGRQWPPPTENTKNLPRPVVNLIKMIVRNKKSALLSSPIRIVYQSEEERDEVEKFNRFAEYIQREMGQEALDKAAIHDGVIKGTYVYHYYWDAEARGMDGIRDGAMRGEMIDPLNIGFSNPEERDEQKQKWILIRSREDVSALRAKCDADVRPEDICTDEAEDPYRKSEQDGDRFCTVLTRYFRRQGEVYYEKATKNVIINRATPLAPDVHAARCELGLEEADAPNNSLPDNAERPTMISKSVRAPLYPVVVGNYEPREKSIYGLGEVEGLIPNQKAVNFMLAMLLLNAQEVAWGKYVVLPQALRGQVITNTPGQTLVDYSSTGQGIRKMTEQSMQSMPLQLIQTLTQLTRTVTGSGEVMTGETIGSGMSGAAIAQLQSQALLPVQELKEAFWLVKEKQGRVMAQFFKLFYHRKAFRYRDRIPKTDGEGIVRLSADGRPMTEEVWFSEEFDGSDYEKLNFEVVAEATGGTKASAAGDINVLDVLLSSGKISLRTYLNAYPKDALSNKSEILRGLEADEQDTLRQTQQRLSQTEEQLRQSVAVLEEQQKTVAKIDSLIRENESLRGMLAQLYQESKEKIAAANRIIAAEQSERAESERDAKEFAEVLMNQKLSSERSAPRE